VRKTLAVVVVGAALFATAVPADASKATAPAIVPAALTISKTTHCTVKTTWRLAGSKANAGVQVKLWWKPSSKAGWTSFCGEAWDAKLSKYRVILQMQPNNYAWRTATGASKVSLRWDVPTKKLTNYWAEANLAFDYRTPPVSVKYLR
jgi:hypothetical protein